MNRVRILTALVTVGVVLAASQWGFAESIAFLTSSGGVYQYAVSSPSVTVDFNPNATITLSGLSDVTGASVSDGLSTVFTVKSFNPSSVVFAQNLTSTIGILGTLGTLFVDSSVLTLGTVDFSMDTTDGTITGTTQGPVAVPVPEPASLALLGTGLLGLVGLARRKRSR